MSIKLTGIAGNTSLPILDAPIAPPASIRTIIKLAAIGLRTNQVIKLFTMRHLETVAFAGALGLAEALALAEAPGSAEALPSCH